MDEGASSSTSSDEESTDELSHFADQYEHWLELKRQVELGTKRPSNAKKVMISLENL